MGLVFRKTGREIKAAAVPRLDARTKAAFTCALSARARHAAIPVIGYLRQGSPESEGVRVTGLRRGLSESGYVEGRNVTIEYRWAENQLDRLSALATDLVQHPEAVIIATGLPSNLAAKATTPTAPIFFAIGINPAQFGLVARLDRPGGNFSGFNAIGGELGGKGLEVSHELLPATASVSLAVVNANTQR
jgi:putative ABC transport system substrate-binding protein